ncbi:MAG: transporter permease [Streptosporangiaceae bacterium]|nr:transporter permease [Streptosporangiaceae bacterium]
MSGFQSLARAMFLSFRRDKRALFFSILFPLMFLVVFGGIFGSVSTSKVKVLEVGSVPMLDQALAHDPAGVNKVMTITKATDRAAALKKVGKGDDDAAVEQQGTQMIVHYSAADRVKAATAQGIINALVEQTNLAATGKPPAYTLVTRQVEDTSLKAIQFITPGMLGWALSSAAMFGAAQTLVTWRTKGILRRLQLSPVPIRNVFAARVAVSLGVALIQTAVFLSVAQLPVFGLKLAGSWWMSIPVVLAGVLAFLAIGMVVGASAKTQDSAQTLIQMIVFPMVFLGGSFFPLDNAPSWLQTVSYAVPLRYLNEGMLNVMGRGLGPASALPQIGVLLGIALVATLVAMRLFRWDDN